MGSYVVDIQGFRAMSNEFLIKEFCIAELGTNYVYHGVVKPAIRYARLGGEFKKRVNFVTNHIHGLQWDSGSMSRLQATTLIKNVLKNASRVYIKGSERVAFLEKLLDYMVPVIDLDIFDYYDNRALKERNIYCHYGHRLRCAVQKACTYRTWLEKHLEKK